MNLNGRQVIDRFLLLVETMCNKRSVEVISYNKLSYCRESELKTGQIMQTIAAKGKIHPGNDCFVMPRAHVPKVLTSMTHPVGLRPW